LRAKKTFAVSYQFSGCHVVRQLEIVVMLNITNIDFSERPATGLIGPRPTIIHAMPMAVATGDRGTPVAACMAIGADAQGVGGISGIMVDIPPPVRLAGPGGRCQVIGMTAFTDITQAVGRSNASFQVFAVKPTSQLHDI
jgi:hypothetical protein